eukprot:Gb_31198 [translate_table: standard]
MLEGGRTSARGFLKVRGAARGYIASSLSQNVAGEATTSIFCRGCGPMEMGLRVNFYGAEVWLVATMKPFGGSSWPTMGVSNPNLNSPTLKPVMSHPYSIGYGVGESSKNDLQPPNVHPLSKASTHHLLTIINLLILTSLRKSKSNSIEPKAKMTHQSEMTHQGGHKSLKQSKVVHAQNKVCNANKNCQEQFASSVHFSIINSGKSP